MKAIVAKIWNREMVVKLILLSMASLLPMLLSRYLKQKKRQQAEAEGYTAVGATEDEADGEDVVEDEENDRTGSRRSSRLFSSGGEGKAVPLPTETVEMDALPGGSITQHHQQQQQQQQRLGGVSRNNSIRSAWL